MSDVTSPVSAAFDFQRNAIEQTREAFKRSVETQQSFGESLVDLGPAKQANEHTYELARATVDIYFDALQAAIPGQQAAMAPYRDAVEEQIETLEATHVEAIETFEANVREGGNASEELFEEITENLDEQFEQVLKAHENVEDQTVGMLDGDFEELRDELEAQREQFAEDLEARLEQFAERTEAQIEGLGERIEDVNEKLEDTGGSLEDIDGLGPTYADRIRAEGIESLVTLAQTEAEVVAEAADVSEQRASEWIEAAQSRA